MRFDNVIDLIVHEIVEDGQGGRTLNNVIASNLNANVEELSVVEAFKIYGEATTDTIKARVLGNIATEADQVKYNNKFYKIINKRFVKNKTVYLLELVQDD